MSLLYYRHVSATYCGHLQGGVFWEVYYKEQVFDILSVYSCTL